MLPPHSLITGCHWLKNEQQTKPAGLQRITLDLREQRRGKKRGGAVLQLYRDRLQREKRLDPGDDRTSQRRRRSQKIRTDR